MAPPPAKSEPKAQKSKNQLSRIKRIEEQMAKLSAKKASLEQALGDPAVYQDAEKVRTVLADQAYVAKELEALETEWLEMNA
jgi:ATP-binding cassette subfamily F protein 3